MGRKRKKKHLTREHITHDTLLALLKLGATLAVAVVAPNALRLLRPDDDRSKRWEPYYQSSIQRQAIVLWRKGLVKVMETKDGAVVTISDKGKQEILKYDIDDMAIALPDHWDGKWRMVFFDIDTGHNEERRVFRQRLKQLGFFAMQKSVYVYPYPCRKEIQFLREVYEVPHSVKLAVVEKMENDDDLKRIFHL